MVRALTAVARQTVAVERITDVEVATTVVLVLRTVAVERTRLEPEDTPK